MVSTSVTTRARATGSAAPRWQEAAVAEVIEEAPDAVTLRLGLEEPGGFLPGQNYNVRLAVSGRERPVQRACSVGSSPAPDLSVIDLGVREVPPGLRSPLLVGLRPGRPLPVRGPYGRFTWSGQDAGGALLVGAGSGLVPLMSMLRHAAYRGRADPVWLICSATTHDHTSYRDELADLADRHRWLRLVQCITRDPAERRAHYHGRVDKGVVAETLGTARPTAAYLCGPPAMVESVAVSLVELGVDPGHIATEKYD
ncbi:MAG: FAD-binding oxidoreductase [Acidimicrobiales bacterium]